MSRLHERASQLLNISNVVTFRQIIGIMDILQGIVAFDKQLLYFINNNLSSPFLDPLMLLCREATLWVPLYLFFLLFFIINCRNVAVQIILLSLVTFALTDFVSASILKPLIGRIRPCHNPHLGFTLINISGCGGLFSMPSSHATNHFGLATFWYFVISQQLAAKWYALWIWAALVCFSQVYVGVHYPGDVLMGALLGTGIGLGTFYLFTQWMRKLVPDRNGSK